jgi:hypothetical protein
MKTNCWEMKQCTIKGRGPAFLDIGADGLNGGVNAGRICWAVAGTLCGGVQGEYAEKKSTCLSCDFYRLVDKEEGREFNMLKPGQVYQEKGR